MAANKKYNPDVTGAVRNQAIGVVVVLLLVAGSIIGGWLYYRSTSKKSVSGPSESTRPQVDSEVNMGPMVDIREFIVNIISDDNSHYLRTSMTIELSNQAAYDEINKGMPKIRDAILMLASSKTFEELYDVHGKKQLKAELLIELNEMLTKGEAVAIYFTDFVVQ
ncbi:MAG: flagellar basal body-associated FliL family protein [Desulfofustis sp.]|nr:flagellar basal body-associated FliL family protein [Desulfofustis sp.]